MELGGNQLSPVLHLKLATPNPNRDDNERELNKIANICLEQGVAVVTAKYLSDEMLIPSPRYVQVTNTDTHTIFWGT